MALVMRGKSRCSLCGRVIQHDDALVGFPHFLAPDHRLGRFSDSAMHEECYETWPHRAEFSELLDQALCDAPGAEDREAQAASERDAEAARTLAHNDEHARIMAEVAKSGATCPHCGTRASAFRVLKETARHRLVCGTCARSCFASELGR